MEKFSLSSYPQYLLVQILRMGFIEGKTVKNDSAVVIPDEVTVDKSIYEVIGVITHMGSAEAGHNRAYLKNERMTKFPNKKYPLTIKMSKVIVYY